MSANKRPLLPSFMQRLDAYWLKNKPAIWQTRVHLVLSYTFIAGLLLAAFSLMIFFDARQNSEIITINTLVILAAFIGFIFWMIYLLRFNVFKRFGNWQLLDGLQNFALLFICIAALVAFCFIPMLVQTGKANLQFNDEEIANDINEINITAARLEYKIMPKKWAADTCIVIPNDSAYRGGDEVVAVAAADTSAYVPPTRRHIDSSSLQENMRSKDSVQRINDSMYVFFESPIYRFLNIWRADEYTKIKILNSKELFYQVASSPAVNDRASLEKRMETLKLKWSIPGRFDYYGDDVQTNESDSYDTRIKKKFGLYNIENGLENVVSHKYRLQQDWPFFLRVFYYTTLVLTLLVFIFRYSTKKAFFLSVLTAVVLMIITGLIIATSYNSYENSILYFIVFYFIVFGTIAFTIFGSKVQLVVQGIALNLFLFMLPFIPLIITGIIASNRSRRYYNTYELQERDLLPDYYFVVAEFIGAIVLLLLLQPVFKRLYRRWYAAPLN